MTRKDMKRTLLLISALVLSVAATAQTDIKNAVVNVENDYTPEVMEVTKKNFTPSGKKEADTEPMTLVFSKSGKAFNGFTSEMDIKDAMPRKEKPFPGYVRLGYGLTNDIDAKAAYRLGVGNNGTLNAYAGFDGYKCKVDGLAGEWDSRLFKTIAGVGYDHRFKGLTLGVNGAFRNSAFNYQGLGASGLSDEQSGQEYRLAINGVSSLAGAWSYDFNAGWDYLVRNWSAGAKNPVGEMRFGAGLGLAYETLNKWVSNFGVGLDMDAFTYNATLKDAGKGYDTYFSIDVDPYANLKLGKWTMKTGARMNILTRGRGAFAIAPDIKAMSNINKHFTVYGAIGGGRTNNSLARLESITPYWGFNGQERLKPTYTIVDACIGSRISFDPLSMEINAGYAYTKDDLLETLPLGSIGAFPLVYAEFEQDNTHHAYADIRLGCDIRSWVKLAVDTRYDFWNCSNSSMLCMKPEITVDANAEARVIEHLTMRVGYTFTRYTKGGTLGRINDKNDLYARISYQINKRFGAYIQGNNLLNCNYYDYAGYWTRGIRGSLGATVNF